MLALEASFEARKRTNGFKHCNFVSNTSYRSNADVYIIGSPLNTTRSISIKRTHWNSIVETLSDSIELYIETVISAKQLPIIAIEIIIIK